VVWNRLTSRLSPAFSNVPGAITILTVKFSAYCLDTGTGIWFKPKIQNFFGNYIEVNNEERTYPGETQDNSSMPFIK
jgi:hypothetical protein